MRDRVTSTLPKFARYYRDRGIDMDPRWNDFATFYADMGDRPDGTTLDRIDNDRGYWPGNCRWATPKQQRHNSRRPVIYVILNGHRMMLTDARVLVAPNGSVFHRWMQKHGATHQQAIDHYAAYRAERDAKKGAIAC
jgi:hypothetical protein